MSNNAPDYENNLYFENNKIQAKDVACNKISLTEQCKKGELPPRYYYIKDNKNKIEIDEYVQWYKERGQKSGKSFIYYKVMEVLAPVPTFDEWKAKLRALDAAHKTIKMEDETINRLVCSGKQCNYENAQLKELLKECKMPLKVYNEMFGYKTELLTKIDEVLK